MGRRKIEIEKRSVSHQVVTYNKRKDGIAKKGRELAIMCDTDVLLITFSPKGKHNLTLGPNSNFENVIRRYASVSPHEREKRKKDSVQTLVKAFKKKSHEIDVDELLNHGESKVPLSKKIEDMTEEIIKRETKLGPLRCIDNLNAVDNVGLLDNMENMIRTLIDQTLLEKQMEKLKIGKPAFPPQEVINQQAPPHVHQMSGSASGTNSSNFHANDMLNMGMGNTSVRDDGSFMDLLIDYNEGIMAQQGGSGAQASFFDDLHHFPFY